MMMGRNLEDARAADAGLVQLPLPLLLQRDRLEPLLLHLAAALDARQTRLSLSLYSAHSLSIHLYIYTYKFPKTCLMKAVLPNLHFDFKL